MRTVKELSEAYAAGAANPTGVTEALIARIERLNTVLNCFITLLKDSALAAARESENRFRAGRPLGPLDGIPIAVKDLIYIEGVRCTAGSLILKDNVANYDSPVAAKLKAAGAVLIGTTNLHEFASGATNVNPHYGAVRNPWDPDQISGGSSGGSAAAVSAGLAPAAIGTDTGGSVRIPAALCGVVGLKPTYGRISRVGVVPLASSFDTVGTLTNSVWDAAVVLGTLAGHDPLDLTTGNAPVPDYLAELGTPPTKVRVGLPRRYFMDQIDPAVRECFMKFTDTLASQSVEVSNVELDGIERAYDVWLPIRRAEAAAFHEQWVTKTPEKYGEDVRKSLEAGLQIPAWRYISAQNSRPALRNAFLHSMKDVDFLAVPTTPMAATRIGQGTIDLGGTETEVYSALVRLTLPFNAVGFPVLSLPIGFSRGLPVGCQIVGKPFEESSLLRFGHACESRSGLFPEPKLQQ
ncbi:MAG: amidase [Nitrososphaerales archaeon]|nr:amidase [Nitrososphaerales archaeon]